VARIFISYASPDRVIADEVLGWLRVAGHEPFLDHDLRDGVSAGEDHVIVGPSGCGKSSLLHAGVVPLLEGDSAWLVVPSLVPGRDPVPELARVLAITGTRLGLDPACRRRACRRGPNQRPDRPRGTGRTHSPGHRR
jgi:hypothetical protein